MSEMDSLEAYAYALHYYRHQLPEAIRSHRRYFRDTHRGFGEDAFHTAWWLLFEERRPGRVLEIGVYRGQIISLWSLIASILDEPCEVHGLSPFEPVGDSVSEYAEGIDYKTDTLAAFERFQLNPPTLVCALSTDEVARRYVQSIAWDLVYVDGNHEYDVVSRDIELALGAVRPGGLVVVDDAARLLPYRPPRFAFAGHEGPSLATMEVDPSKAARLGHVGHMVFLERRSDAASRRGHLFQESANKPSGDVEH
jgi:predicted O-methyltransferase YrrM